MFKVNDVIVYGNTGVCEIQEIGVPDFVTNNQSYYKLKPLNTVGNMIYVSLNNKHMLRYTVSRMQAEQYVGCLKEIQGIYNTNNKVREREYSEIIKQGDYNQYLGLFKGVEQEKLRRSQTGKSINAMDDKSLKRVEKLICSEFAVAMDMSEEEVLQKMVEACV